jgi:3-phosphoshikimate 1-carboxyvinyltransferase
MRVRVKPGGRVGGEPSVPGDKSIAHRWLIAAAVGRGRSRLIGLPRALDTRSTALCLSRLASPGGPALEAWASRSSPTDERNGSTWNRSASTLEVIEVEGEGRSELRRSNAPLDCGNSGTTIRLLAGLVSGCAFTTVLDGDESLRARPMDRIAGPLREMGAHVDTTDGKPPITVVGGELRGISFEPTVPSAQVKGAVLFAALAAHGPTAIHERVPTRDHTERLLRALGVPIVHADGRIELAGPVETGAIEGTVPGDPSAAAFLVGAAALTGSRLTTGSVGVNPTRLRWLEVLRRMGVPSETTIETEEVGEPVGRIEIGGVSSLVGTRVPPDELPLVIDEVPILAAIGAHADGESRFEGGAELRIKESDRLEALVDGVRGLGGDASVEGDDLVVAGGGLRGGAAVAAGDHRIAMALVVAGLAAAAPCEVGGVEAADVSFPGFLQTLRAIGADLEETP